MIGDRVRKAREYAGFSLDVFCKKIEVSKRTLQNYEKNTSEPNASTIINIANLCHISEYWLFNGKGEMLLKSDNNSQSGMVCEPSSSYGKLSTKDMVVVNVYPDVYASAGLGNALTESTSHQTLMDKTLLRDVFNVRNFSNLDMIKVIGDSMAPIINDGEVLFIERGAHAKNGDTVIATLNDELYVKRFRKDPFGEWVRLESENKDFPHIELNTPQKIAMLNIIGIARSKVKVY